MASSAECPSAAPSMAGPPPPLERFGCLPAISNGALSRDALQKILASPIEASTCPRASACYRSSRRPTGAGRAPDFEHVPAWCRLGLVQRLRKDAAFSLVTEMMPIPVGRARHGSAARGGRALSPALRRAVSRGCSRSNTTSTRGRFGYATVIRRRVPAGPTARGLRLHRGRPCSTSRPGSSCSPRGGDHGVAARGTSGRTSEKLADPRVEHRSRMFAPDTRDTTSSSTCGGFANAAEIAENAKHASGEAVVSVPPTERVDRRELSYFVVAAGPRSSSSPASPAPTQRVGALEEVRDRRGRERLLHRKTRSAVTALRMQPSSLLRELRWRGPGVLMSSASTAP